VPIFHRRRIFLQLGASLTLSVMLAQCGAGGSSGELSRAGGASKNSGFIFKGIHHVSFSNVEYSTVAGKVSQDALAATGANWAGVVLLWFMPTSGSSSIAPATTTPSDNDVVAAITELHAKGLKVNLKPIVYPLDGWQGTIDPVDVNGWFASFNNFILHYAAMAANNHVEMLTFGTEYKLMSAGGNLSSWTDTITQIRNVYSGLLAYNANAGAVADEYTSVSFWNLVDVIGLDAYFSLTNHADPTVAEIKAAWSMNWRGENLVAAIQNFASAYPNRTVIFSEIGYQSKSGTNTNPWDWGTPGPVDDGEQQDCYEAMYEVWSQQASIKGNFWWDWPVAKPNLATDTDYSTWTKPAEGVLNTWQ
jgi:hypothetical protein